MDRFLVQTLINIGFNEKESRVLLASFSLGKATVGEITKRAELKRAIVYVILEDLTKQGYMTRIPTRGIKTYQAIPPEKLLDIRHQQVENFRFMLPLILSHQTRSSNIEFHDTLEGVLSVSHTFGSAKHACYLTNYSLVRQHYGEATIKKWVASAHNSRQKTRVRQLVVDTDDGRMFAKTVAGSKTWQVRILPQNAPLHMNFAIVDETIAITNFNPLSMMVMHSKEIAQAFECLFDALWKGCVPDKHRLKNKQP